jgi:transcriptional regulator with XRE-family HTH domain
MVGAFLMAISDDVRGEPNALESLRRVRSRLEVENPVFRAASILERRADRFVERVRVELKSRRKKLRWDQQQLGRRIGFSQSAISKLESGQAELSLKALYRMADAMGLRPVIAFVPAVRSQIGYEADVAGAEPTRAEEAACAIEEAQAEMIRHVAQAMAPMTELAAAATEEGSERILAVATAG